MDIKRLRFKETIVIHKIASFHYVELPNHYDEELNYNFWQFLYVDKGEMDFVCSERFRLKQGTGIFIPPYQPRRGVASRESPPNLLIISFDCLSPAIGPLANHPFALGDGERAILVEMIKEGKHSYDPPPTVAHSQGIKRRKNPLLGSEQMVRNYLEILVLRILRNNESLLSASKISTTVQENVEKEIADRLLSYIETNIMADLSMERICKDFAMSRTHLYNIFKKRTGHGISEFIKKLRIEKAKIFIREEKYNYTEIAEFLHYSSIHYFSKDFKKVTGMTPTEYARTIKARF